MIRTSRAHNVAGSSSRGGTADPRRPGRRALRRGALLVLPLLAALLAAPGCADPARERFEAAERALLAQKMEAALAGFRAIPKEFPQSRYASASLLRQGDLFGSFFRNYPAALDAYDSLVYNYPGSAEVPQAWLRKGEIRLLQLFDHAAAIADLERLRREFPGFERMDEALFLLAKAYGRVPDPSRQASALSELIGKFPTSPRLSEARWMVACGYLAQRRFEEAEREFRKLLYLASTPKEAARARWGTAQALEGMDRLEQALEQYEAVGSDGEDPAYVARKIAYLKKRLRRR